MMMMTQSSTTVNTNGISVKTGPLQIVSATTSNLTSSLAQRLQNSPSIPASTHHLQPHNLPKLGNATNALKASTNAKTVGVNTGRVQFHLTPAKNAIPFHSSNITIAVGGQTKNISSSLYQTPVLQAVPTAAAPKDSDESPARNIKEEHKDSTTTSTGTQANQSGSGGDDYPSFPSSYHASGIIILPESKIAEPFEIWYAPDLKKSRIDYYYGKVFIYFYFVFSKH